MQSQWQEFIFHRQESISRMKRIFHWKKSVRKKCSNRHFSIRYIQFPQKYSTLLSDSNNSYCCVFSLYSLKMLALQQDTFRVNATAKTLKNPAHNLIRTFMPDYMVSITKRPMLATGNITWQPIFSFELLKSMAFMQREMHGLLKCAWRSTHGVRGKKKSPVPFGDSSYVSVTML